MPRKVLTESEKAQTPLSEDFLANPKLKAAIESLSEMVKQEMPEDAKFSYSAIAQAAGYLRAVQAEEFLAEQRREIEEKINELNRLKAHS